MTMQIQDWLGKPLRARLGLGISKRLLMGVLLSIAASTLGARDGAGPSPLPGNEGLFTTALGLVFIIGLILAAAWVFKRLGGLPGGGHGLVRVLGGVSLGARERVVVVEVEGTRLVLGVAPGRVETLHVLPPKENFHASLQQAQETNP